MNISIPSAILTSTHTDLTLSQAIHMSAARTNKIRHFGASFIPHMNISIPHAILTTPTDLFLTQAIHMSAARNNEQIRHFGS